MRYVKKATYMGFFEAYMYDPKIVTFFFNYS